MGFMDVCITLILKGGNGTYVNSNANTEKHIRMPILRILYVIIFSQSFQMILSQCLAVEAEAYDLVHEVLEKK